MEKSFENAMARLNEISLIMNDEELPLEKAVKLYSEAAELIVACQGELDSARLSLKELFGG